MSEKTVQEAIQTAIQGMAEFDNADVVINDWGVLDGERMSAPFVIIENSDEVMVEAVVHDADTLNVQWHIPITIVENFVDWKTSLDNLRDHRQAVLALVNVGLIVTSGQAGITQTRTTGPIADIYDKYLTPENSPEAQPIYISQKLILDVEEY